MLGLLGIAPLIAGLIVVGVSTLLSVGTTVAKHYYIDKPAQKRAQEAQKKQVKDGLKRTFLSDVYNAYRSMQASPFANAVAENAQKIHELKRDTKVQETRRIEIASVREQIEKRGEYTTGRPEEPTVRV